MFYISYQGIFDGSDYQNANTPPQISKSLGAGFSVLVDVWRNNNKLYVGSVENPIEVTEKYLQGPRFYINAKNTDMQNWLTTQPSNLYPNYFHFLASTPPPPYAVVSNGKLMTPGTVPINNDSIIFLPEIDDQSLYSTVKLKCYGVVSNFLLTIRRMRNEGVWY